MFLKTLQNTLQKQRKKALCKARASPARVFKDAVAANPKEMGPLLQKMQNDTRLKKLPLMADIANTAVFLSSDMAGKITGVTIDVTCGTTAGLNYRAAL